MLLYYIYTVVFGHSYLALAYALPEANELFMAHQGKYPVGHNKMESFRLHM